MGINKKDNMSYYRRFNYPMRQDNKIGYKCGSLSIVKFNRDLNSSDAIMYEFVSFFNDTDCSTG